MEAYIFDIFLGLTAIFIIAVSAKKGFTLTLLNTISLGLSGFLSYKFSKPIAEFIYSSFLYDRIKLKLSEVLTGLSQELSFDDKIDAMVESFPEWLLNVSQGFGLDINTAIKSLQPVDLNNDAIVKVFLDDFASDIIISVLEVVVLLALFLILSFLFKNISVLFSKLVKKIPIVGKTNTILGGVLGVVKAIVIIVIICVVFSTVVFAMDIPDVENIVSDSYVYRFITDSNLFSNFI